MPSTQRDSTSLISKSSPGDFEKMFTVNFDKSCIKGEVKDYTTQKCTLKDLQKEIEKMDNQRQDADEEEEETDEEEEEPDGKVKKRRIDYDSVGGSIVSRILTSREYTVEVTNSTSITEYKELIVPTVSSVIKPDISIKDSENNKITYIEVLSETLVKTIRKLFFDLLLQLLYIRSVNKKVYEVSGFVLPAGKADYIVLATVQWDVREFKFIGKSKPLSSGSFTQKLLDTIETQKTYFKELNPSCKPKYVSQSLSSQDVVAYLGSDEFSQGEFVKCVSIVYMMQDQVYKMPVTGSAEKRLLDLFYQKQGSSPKQVLLPHYRKKRFFVYPRLDKPSDIKSLKDSYISFAASVINALDELHGQLGLAHLDVRLPNICFRKEDSEAVLIDLDDSQPIGHRPVGVFNVDSHMYSKQYENTENYDWRQLAIILLRIWECKDFDYHKGSLEFPKSEFGQELEACFDEGRKPNLKKLQSSEICRDGASTEGHLTKKRDGGKIMYILLRLTTCILLVKFEW